MGKLVALDRVKLTAVTQVWLRKLPIWAWGKELRCEKLGAKKRHDPAAEPDPKRMVAELIAEEIDRLGWEVSYEERRDIFSEHWPISTSKKSDWAR